MNRIDSHFHLWQLGQHDQSWPTPDLTAIHRDFLLPEFEALADAHAVQSAVLVQSQPSAFDTEWLLSLAGSSARIAGVVGWCDLAAPDAAQRVATLARHRKLKGLRPMLQALPDDDWIARPQLNPALVAMSENALVFDALIYTRHWPYILRLAQRHPRLAIVIDHAAKPPVARCADDPEACQRWQEAMSRLAGHANVYCKLSGLVTELGPDQSAPLLQPYVEHLLAQFGPDRLLWGSDWPVCTLRLSYADTLAQILQLLGPLSVAEQEAIFSGTARKVYRL